MSYIKIPALLSALFIAIGAQAAPFLRSDPWPAGKPQPTICLYQEGALDVIEVPVTLDSKGLPYCKWDLATVTRDVEHSLQVWVRNATHWSEKVPFVFTISSTPIQAPKTLRIISR